jgi:hypothetical protein
MKKFKCTKCNSEDIFVEGNGYHVGLYCGECGGWIKWLNKNEERLARRQEEKNRESGFEEEE